MDNAVNYVLTLKDGMSPVIKKATGDVEGLDGAVNTTKKSVMSLGSAVGIAFGVGAIVSFTKQVVSAGTMVEDATTGLTTLLKDADAAAQVVKNTMEDATKTPFAFEGLLAGNKALISAGVSAEQSREDVLNLSNAIAATGGGNAELQRMVINMQQIKNVGKATAEDIKQFGFAGINIYQVLAEATGKTAAEVKELPVSYEMLTQALKQAGEEGGVYANGLANMSQNTSVRISNIGDSLFVLFNDLFVTLKPLIDGILNAVLGLIDGLSGLLAWIKENSQAIGDIIIVLGSAAVAFGIMTLATNASSIAYWGLGVALQAYSIFQNIATVAAYAFSAALWANPITWVVAGVAALVAGIIALTRHFGGFTNAMTATWDMIKAFGKGVGGIFKGLGKSILGFLTFDPAMIKEGLSDAMTAAKTGAKEISDVWNNEDAQQAADEAKEKKKSLVPDKNITNETKTTTNVTTAAPKTKATGQKNINIKVTYNAPIVKDITIKTTTINQGVANLKEEITKVLTAATHDAVIIADN